MEEIEITYDKWGRMNYHPEFHANDGLQWLEEEDQYLIDWYDVIGPVEMSFALERTIKAVNNRVAKFRKKGIMKKPEKRNYHKNKKRVPEGTK